MNAWTISANLLVFLAFIIHTIVGDKELKVNEPAVADELNTAKKREKWTMARCGWHLVSFDLLFASIGLALVNFTSIVKDTTLVLQIISLYFLAYALVWLLVVVVSKQFAGNFIKLGQWILLLVVSLLTFLGI